MSQELLSQELQEAYREWEARQSRQSHPNGTFDNGGRWYPSENEEQSCCQRIRQPSRAWPYSLNKHCRSMAHIANLFSVNLKELRALSRQALTPQREGGEGYYKLVALVGERMLSIYDGKTEYQLGVTLSERARQNHNGGYYVYNNPIDAKNAPFPRDSALLDAPRVLLRVKAEGQYCRYDKKLSFSKITPLEVVQ